MDNTDVYKKLETLANNDQAILEKITEVRVSLARTEGQIMQNTSDLTRNTHDMAAHIKRTHMLESYLDRSKGFVIAISILSPLAAGLLTFLTHYFLNL